jgi:hypothetical protein
MDAQPDTEATASTRNNVFNGNSRSVMSMLPHLFDSSNLILVDWSKRIDIFETFF